MAYQDMRAWIQKLEEEGELKRIQTEVDWNLEIGGILREVCDRCGPALLFENIKDHKDTLCTRLFTA
ncbi:MAG: UbiD family decarboxylase, partial [Candidatus Zixiibacteriota bacterium]